MDANTAVERMTPENYAQITARLTAARFMPGGKYFGTHAVYHKWGRMIYLPLAGQPLPDGMASVECVIAGVEATA